MVPELGKPRVTEILVRMDCNGCVQKIKKALHGINGIYDLYIDFPQQKLTIIGWADPEKIVKAIKKTRKTATICSHTEPTEPPPQPTEPSPEGGAPAPESANPPPAEAPPAEAAQPAEPPKDPPPPENPPPEQKPSPAAPDATPSQPAQPSGPKEVEKVHVIYQHPPDFGYRYGYGNSYGQGHNRQWNTYTNGPGFRQEPAPPVYVTHSYSTFKPSPHVTEYSHVQSPPRYTHYSRQEHYSEDYHHGNNGNGNISSMFSDENPNACRIV
ncbi:unnamed protein product [Ilex paraguariensis]|uniref:HMA domain-containing protein n=1 Tax=Ilex paraguariensis TaxID=185542 RepID=A0ABC8R2B8_9AQUA